MGEAERTREKYEHKHAEELQSLQEEMTNSRLAMDRIKQELLDSTTRKLEDMHSAITASQKAIEASMKDQARYWKSICEELVVEKRDMAQKVAEERGKYTALKAHLASHDDTTARQPFHTRARIRDAYVEESVAKMRLCELSPPSASPPLTSGNQGSNEESGACTSICGTPTGSSSGLVAVPSADSVSEPSSAEVSPTHSSSSSVSISRTGKPTAFRRYYLAQKRVVLH
ncbi:Choline/Carnitine O-acyltransferase [Phytophthora cinnamomi]|uniref:Choline/Carnitine O-acyltransferase n=1 Tax=Phytophthora cinnamomi TaxID=4785 RepID=UPI00355AA0A4|nr:Choline/Carnitine O-acyltransferase [Phytophthora cinnamomi]